MGGLYVHGPSATFLDVNVLSGHAATGSAARCSTTCSSVPRARRAGASQRPLDSGRCRVRRAVRLPMDNASCIAARPADAVFRSRRPRRAGRSSPGSPRTRRASRGIRHSSRRDGRRAFIGEFEFPTRTAERRCARPRNPSRCRNREIRVTVAISPTGRSGVHRLRVLRGSTLGFTDDTGTVAAHRGQGLAQAVKVGLSPLREDHPEIDVVSTSNAEENAAMRSVNEQVGFPAEPSRRSPRSTCQSRSPATLLTSCHATGPSASRSWARPSSAPPPPGSPRVAPVPSSAGLSWGSSCWPHSS